MIFQKLYEISPIWLQNVGVTLKGYKNNKSRYGEEYFNYIEFLKWFEKLSLEKKIEVQNDILEKFINYSVNKSKYYKGYKEANCLSDFPIMDKEELRKNINSIHTISAESGIESHTGGTTGKSLIVRFSKEDMMRRMATLDYFKMKAGFIHLKMKRATFNGKHIVPQNQTKKVFWRYNHACKQMIFSSFHLSSENMIYYINSLNKFKPDSIDGFFTSIYEVAKYIELNNIVLNFKPIAIFPTSETISDEGRELVERVFQCKVYNQYASSEGAPFITECDKGGLHIELASGVFEMVENDEVLVTSFTTHGTPLIRYQIGDQISLNHNTKCECGVETLLAKEIKGRKLDYLLKADGTKINSANIANAFKNLPNVIIQSQVIQLKENLISVKIVVDKKNYDLRFNSILEKEFKDKFGKEMVVMIEQVDNIPREKSGKHLFIKNML
ncbi:phenylacetate--CoA ligase family protein [Exiguobacterium sp. s129]|uniref:phenylacetate--CoA ligase family protein n=1 Tax=Exiguobacterium sp. s129 TaxID=2751264 RepID=UPI001BEB753B|nr:phenylacetate--CoA ligase family protein [Exiguobacterium sp. s129]